MTMANKESSNTSAKLLYRPIGLVNGLISGALAGVVNDGLKLDTIRRLKTEHSWLVTGS